MLEKLNSSRVLKLKTRSRRAQETGPALAVKPHGADSSVHLLLLLQSQVKQGVEDVSM
jgi:hypothetical protein